MRGWIDNRARALRDDVVVRAVVVFEGRQANGRPYWELGIRLSDYPESMAAVRHLVQGLEMLKARPELVTEGNQRDLRSTA